MSFKTNIQLKQLQSLINRYRSFTQDNVSNPDQIVIDRANKLHSQVLDQWEICKAVIDFDLDGIPGKELITKLYLSIKETGQFISITDEIKSLYLTSDQRAGGKNSKRKPDLVLIESAKNILSENKMSYHLWTKSQLYKYLVKKGFVGSEGWVKKHFDTITKLS